MASENVRTEDDQTTDTLVPAVNALCVRLGMGKSHACRVIATLSKSKPGLIEAIANASSSAELAALVASYNPTKPQ